MSDRTNPRRATRAPTAGQCFGKVRHRTLHAAVAASRRSVSLGVTSYACDLCGGYHVGHAAGATAKRRMIGGIA